MQSVQEYEDGSKRKILVVFLNRALLLIERMWGMNDLLLRKRLSDAHRALGELRDELDIRQTARLA